MQSRHEQELRKRLVRHLKGGEAFSTVDAVVEGMPYEKIGLVPEGLPYSFYQQFYHIRFAQYDILEYCRSHAYQAPDWPGDYWPDRTEPEEREVWENLAASYFDERKEFSEFILDPSNDLFQEVSDDSGHTLLREVQLVIEHTAYHTGQLYIIKRLVG